MKKVFSAFREPSGEFTLGSSPVNLPKKLERTAREMCGGSWRAYVFDREVQLVYVGLDEGEALLWVAQGKLSP